MCVPSVPGTRPICPVICPVCPGDILSFSIDLHINQAQMSQVSLGRPEFVPGTPPGHPTAKFLYVIFFIGFFFLSLFDGLWPLIVRVLGCP